MNIRTLLLGKISPVTNDRYWPKADIFDPENFRKRQDLTALKLKVYVAFQMPRPAPTVRQMAFCVLGLADAIISLLVGLELIFNDRDEVFGGWADVSILFCSPDQVHSQRHQF